MYRIVNCNTSKDCKPNNCKPWRAPDLDVINDNNYDFKLVNPETTSHREQQEKIRQQSYEKSYAKGYMEGLAKGQEQAQEQVQSLHSVMASLAMPLANVDGQVVDELAQLCMVIVKQMVRRELKTSPDEIVAIVREALNLLPVTAAEITLELHPEDARIIRDALSHPDSQPDWRIVEDVMLSRGGCCVTTSKSRIDASVEKRLNTLIAEVMGSERKLDAEQ